MSTFLTDAEKNQDVCSHIENEHRGEDAPAMPDPEAERRLVRKLDRTILPWIMLLYLLSYLDRYVPLLSDSTSPPANHTLKE
jgi:hypothetical protein